MKKILLLLLIPCLSYSQTNTNLEKAKTSVKRYLSLTMNDFKSYEPVQWSKLNSVYTAYEDTEEYNTYKTLMVDNAIKAAPFKKIADSYVATWGLETAQKNPTYQENTDSVKKYMAFSNTAKDIAALGYKAFKPQFIYYKITHRFRGKNEIGALVINDKDFYLNKKLEVIKTLNTISE